MKLAATLLLCAAAASTQPAGPALAPALNFENGTLEGWNAGPTASLDGKIVHSGKWAARIARTPSDTGGFSGILRSLPMDFAGAQIEMRGYLRTENVSDYVGMWMREDGDSGSVAFDNMQSRQLRGTHDWAEYSIVLPVKPDGRSLFFGVFVAGTGTAWVDDLQLLVDGKPIWEAPKAERAQTPLDTDHEFDSGSGIALDNLTPAQVDNLVTLGKVWGFLKYHHPAVTGGTRHWDYDLFRVLPAVLAAPDRAAANAAIAKWADALPAGPACHPCAELDPDGLQLHPDVAWIRDEARLGPELSRLLRAAYTQRPADGKQFYVGKARGAGNPEFEHEAPYPNAKPGDAGMQLLAAYRYWNIVEYWFPDRDLIAADWDAVLRDALPKIALAKTAPDYHRELMAFIAQAHDTHSNLWSSLADRPPVGPCVLAATVRPVEHQWVVADAPSGPLQRGDSLLALDGAPLASQVQQWRRFYADSNDAAFERDLARQITRGPCGATTVSLRRNGQELAVQADRVPPPPPSTGYHDLPGDAFRLLGGDVAYVKISALKRADVKRDIDRAAGTKGLIVDLRDYPSDFPLFDLGQLLVTAPTPFVHFTGADLANPGAFRWQAEVSLKPEQPHYSGKIVILVDEVTQSSAEYHAMAFRRVPGAVVVGSTTAGADGNISPFALPGGLRTMVSGLGVFYPDLKPTQRVGIVPDVEVLPTVAGIAAGRDEVLEKALAIVLQQPVTPEEAQRRIAPPWRPGLPLDQSASRGIVTRDPSTIVKCKDEYWVFYTGRGIPSYHSRDLASWEPGPPVFQTAPQWIAAAVPLNRNMSYWAPDIIHLGDRYLLYYSVSSFGKITSAIGLATTPTLDPSDPAYRWTDQGIVVQSHEGGDFNTIDPSVFHDDDGSLWLSFGSYWSGIKLVELDPKTGKRLHPDAPLTALAYNKSIEASSLYKHDGYYYLFVNWGSCCKGVESTYNIRVGRSRKITGPYLDKEGVDMLKGGGTLFLSSRAPLYGPGHAAFLTDNGKTWFTSDFEGDTRMGGKATLAIMPLTWNSGWPEAEVVDR